MRGSEAIILLAGLALLTLALTLPLPGGGDDSGGGGAEEAGGAAAAAGSGGPDLQLCDTLTERLMVDDPDEGGTIFDVWLVIVLDPNTLCDIISVDLTVDYVPDRPLSGDAESNFLIVEVYDFNTKERLMRKELTVSEPVALVNIPDAWHGKEILVTVYNYS